MTLKKIRPICSSMVQESQGDGQNHSFLKNSASNLPPIGGKLLLVVLGLVLFCIFISDLDGNMESILVILINVAKLAKVVW